MFIQKSICPVNMVKFLYDLEFLDPQMYGYATSSYNQILDHLKFWLAHTAAKNSCFKGKKRFRQS